MVMTAGAQQAAKLKTRVKAGATVRYLLYLPPGYGKDDRRWPLVLFLHGAGERGRSLEAVKRHGPPKLVEQGEDFPFILVSPLCPADEQWSVPLLRALLENVEGTHRTDPARIYLTGLSMGGNGTWRLAAAMPGHFAAIAPVCGWGDAGSVCALKEIPVWVFHGKKDGVVPFEASEAMVDALKECGGNVRFTEYPDAGHDSWTETYENPELYAWLLAQRRE
jgi:predicted peptidase